MVACSLVKSMTAAAAETIAETETAGAVGYWDYECWPERGSQLSEEGHRGSSQGPG